MAIRTEKCPVCGEVIPNRIYGHGVHVTIRESTAAEKTSMGWNPLTPPEKRNRSTLMRAKKYLLVDFQTPTKWYGAFFMPHTANSKKEIVYWAERFCSKSDATFVRPKGWENIVGELNGERS